MVCNVEKITCNEKSRKLKTKWLGIEYVFIAPDGKEFGEKNSLIDGLKYQLELNKSK